MLDNKTSDSLEASSAVSNNQECRQENGAGKQAQSLESAPPPELAESGGFSRFRRRCFRRYSGIRWLTAVVIIFQFRSFFCANGHGEALPEWDPVGSKFCRTWIRDR